MPGTRHFVPRHLALSERAATVSAGVVEREDLAVDVEQGNLFALHIDQSSLARLAFVFATFTKSAIWGSCALNMDRTNTLALPLPWSSAAKRLVHHLIGPRRIGVAAEHRLILVRHGEHRQ